MPKSKKRLYNKKRKTFKKRGGGKATRPEFPFSSHNLIRKPSIIIEREKTPLSDAIREKSTDGLSPEDQKDLSKILSRFTEKKLSNANITNWFIENNSIQTIINRLKETDLGLSFSGLTLKDNK